jgi:hypothetical protein
MASPLQERRSRQLLGFAAIIARSNSAKTHHHLKQRPTGGRGRVEALLAQEICQLMISPRTNGPICKETLEKHFRAELDRGMAVADFNVLGCLCDKAASGDTAVVQSNSAHSKKAAIRSRARRAPSVKGGPLVLVVVAAESPDRLAGSAIRAQRAVLLAATGRVRERLRNRSAIAAVLPPGRSRWSWGARQTGRHSNSAP